MFTSLREETTKVGQKVLVQDHTYKGYILSVGTIVHVTKTTFKVDISSGVITFSKSTGKEYGNNDYRAKSVYLYTDETYNTYLKDEQERAFAETLQKNIRSLNEKLSSLVKYTSCLQPNENTQELLAHIEAMDSLVLRITKQ